MAAVASVEPNPVISVREAISAGACGQGVLRVSVSGACRLFIYLFIFPHIQALPRPVTERCAQPRVPTDEDGG